MNPNWPLKGMQIAYSGSNLGEATMVFMMNPPSSSVLLAHVQTWSQHEAYPKLKWATQQEKVGLEIPTVETFLGSTMTFTYHLNRS